MAILSVRRFPDSVLKRPTDRVGAVADVERLIHDLIQTMRHHSRCVGLAAPQIGVSQAVAVVDVTGHPRAQRSSGLIVLVNPEILAQDGSRVLREGCLSVPDLTGNVSRARRVQVRAQGADGEEWTRWFEDFEAIAMQHELDHLAGKLFLDRIANLRTDVFRRQDYG